MSGGIAYVLDLDGTFASRCNPALVALDPLGQDDEEELRALLAEHLQRTGSPVAQGLLDHWDPARFVKVFPNDYRRALEETARELALQAA
jgi:glutamate synthase (NADPH/NADH) large chain